jgi:dimeric dUTPase (all-alpha-NTP-PPase superfamily)
MNRKELKERHAWQHLHLGELAVETQYGRGAYWRWHDAIEREPYYSKYCDRIRFDLGYSERIEMWEFERKRKVAVAEMLDKITVG